MEVDVADGLQALHGRLERMTGCVDAALEWAAESIAGATPSDAARERVLGAEAKAFRAEVSKEAFRAASDRPVPAGRGDRLASAARTSKCLHRIAEDSLWIVALANTWPGDRPDVRLERLVSLLGEDREMLADGVLALRELDPEGARCILQRAERVETDRVRWHRGLIASLGDEPDDPRRAVLAGEFSRRCAGIEGSIGEVAHEVLHHVWFRAGVWGMLGAGEEA